MEHERLVEELHKPARCNYTHRKYDVRGLDETWQADLFEMIPLKRKTGKDVSEAMKSVLVKGRVPKNLHTDRGKEFYNSDFQKLMNPQNKVVLNL